VIVMDATAAQLCAFYGTVPPRTCRTWAVVDGVRVVGVCGYMQAGAGFRVFADLTPELRRCPRVILQAARHVLTELRGKKVPVTAICDETIPAAARFLAHFGFKRQLDGVFLWT
jgi:hypothetical protein